MHARRPPPRCRSISRHAVHVPRDGIERTDIMTQDAQERARAAMRTRAVTAATVGTALEWFDFTLYGALAATVLPKLFFPAMDSTTALLASLATFGVGLAERHGVA